MSWIERKWLWLRSSILRERKPADFIARGWAIGMFYGCTIPFGFQLALSLPTAFFMKGSKVGATLGTFITNHFTIFLIYPAQCWVGNRLMGGNLSFGTITTALKDVVEVQEWSALMQLGGELVESFFVGGFVLAAVCVPLTYVGVLRFVRRHRAAVERKEAARG